MSAGCLPLRLLTRLCLAGWPAALSAQTLVIGRVTVSGRPLGQAEVSIEPGALTTQTTDSGKYRLLVPAAGMVRIAVRAVGFSPGSRRFALAGGDTLVADFVLTPVAQPLDSITVTARTAPPAGKMRGFEDRRRMGFGHFYTRDFLASRENSTLANVLRLTAGLQLVPRPPRCGGGHSIATGRGGVYRWEPWMSCGGANLVAACYSLIYLDGARFWVPGPPKVPPPDIDEFKVIDLEGVEVYRSGSEAPLQYLASGSDCGVILLWTRVNRP